MANVVTGLVWFIDTPGATAIYKTPVKVKQVFWNNAPAAGNFTITDIFNRVVLAATLASTGQQPTWAPDEWWHGLIVTVLSAGQLQITVD